MLSSRGLGWGIGLHAEEEGSFLPLNGAKEKSFVQLCNRKLFVSCAIQENMQGGKKIGVFSIPKCSFFVAKTAGSRTTLLRKHTLPISVRN